MLQSLYKLPSAIFQDDIALVVCMVILMSVTGGIVMFKVMSHLTASDLGRS